MTTVPSVSLSSLPSGSVRSLCTLAVLEMSAVRASLTCTVTCTVAEPPSAIVPRFHVTVPAASTPPPSADTNEVPAGTASVTTVLVAPEGPAFATTSVYVTFWPASTGSAESVFTIDSRRCA